MSMGKEMSLQHNKSALMMLLSWHQLLVRKGMFSALAFTNVWRRVLLFTLMAVTLKHRHPSCYCSQVQVSVLMLAVFHVLTLQQVFFGLFTKSSIAIPVGRVDLLALGCTRQDVSPHIICRFASSRRGAITGKIQVKTLVFCRSASQPVAV